LQAIQENKRRIFMDIVYITDLKIETVIGIYAWEREVKQIVSIDLEMAHDIREAATRDDIQYALNYKAVAKRLISFIESSEFLLVESMAQQVADIVQNEFSVPWLTLSVSKPGALRGAKNVGVRIIRGEMPKKEAV